MRKQLVLGLDTSTAAELRRAPVAALLLGDDWLHGWALKKADPRPPSTEIITLTEQGMRELNPTGPLGGNGKTVEFDETYVGGKEKNKHASKRNKRNRRDWQGSRVCIRRTGWQGSLASRCERDR